MQQDLGYDLNDDINIAIVGISRVVPIDLGYVSSDEMNITTIGVVGDGQIDLGFDLGDETKIVASVAPKKIIAPKNECLQ